MAPERTSLQTAKPWGFVKTQVRSLAKGETMTFDLGHLDMLVLISGGLEIRRAGGEPELVLALDQGPVRVEPGIGPGQATALSSAQVVIYWENRSEP